MSTEQLTTTAPVTMQDVMSSQATFPFFEIHERGVTFNIECPEDTWRELATAAAAAFQASGITHCRMIAKLADILNFGDTKFGERSADVIDCTAGFMKLSAKTIENAMTTFLKIPEERRRVDELTFEHHKLVQKLDPKEQEEFLKLAISDGLSVSALREAIAERHPKKKINTKKKAAVDPDAPKISEEEAIKAAETLCNYFDQAEEKDGPLSKWEPERIKRFANLTHPLELTAKRLRNAAKKLK